MSADPTRTPETAGATSAAIGGGRLEIRHSLDIAKLFAALSKAQAQFKHADKSSLNPNHNKKYADLASVLDACREALAANELAVLQPPTNKAQRVTVTTILGHSSGQWMACDIEVTAAGPGAQALGSAITYGRRYGLSALLGIAPDADDDGEAAEGRNLVPGTAAWKAEQKRQEQQGDGQQQQRRPAAQQQHGQGQGQQQKPAVNRAVEQLVADFNQVRKTDDYYALKDRYETALTSNLSDPERKKIVAAKDAAFARINPGAVQQPKQQPEHEPGQEA